MPGLVAARPPGLAGGAGRRVAPGGVVRAGRPGLRQVMVDWLVHRGLLVLWLGLSRGCGRLLCRHCAGAVMTVLPRVRAGRGADGFTMPVMGGDRADAGLAVA